MSIKLKKFIDFNKTCPICNKELTLYMQGSGTICWRAERKKDTYTFKQFKNESEEFSDEDFIILHNKKNKIDIKYSANKIANKYRSIQMFLFYLCDERAFVNKKNSTFDDWEIKTQYGCYIRSSPWFEYYKINNKWELDSSDISEELNAINFDEIFYYSHLNKYYTLRIDYLFKEMTLTYCTYTEEQKNDESYVPDTFHLNIPMWKARPDFSEKEKFKLISKFDSWILLS